MDFLIPISISELQPKISYQDKIMLIGSCFTEHIGKFLEEDKFDVLQNPNGIIFDPNTISKSIISWIENEKVEESELFQQDEIWHSWKFHSRFSDLKKDVAIKKMNDSIENAHHYLKKAKWLIITLGTSYCYQLAETGTIVANCHKVPANQFKKHLNTITESIEAFDIVLYRLFKFNPDLNIIFTVSPVRHIRDGIVENTLSKARLIEVVHHLVNKFSKLHYFPSYELMIDVLRDYRFYDADLVHPNYAGTSYVLENFAKATMSEMTQKEMETMHKIFLAKNHKPFNPNSLAHKKFLEKFYNLSIQMQKTYPNLDFEKEIKYFESFQNISL